MALLQWSDEIASVSGKIKGGVIRQAKVGSVYYSNNYGKRGHTWRSYQERAQFSALSSAWRSLTLDEQATWKASSPRPPGQEYGLFNPGTISPGDNYGHDIFKMLNSMKQTKGKALYKKKTSYKPSSVKFDNVSGTLRFTFDTWTHEMQIYTASVLHGSLTFTMQIGPFTPIWKKVNTLKYTQFYYADTFTVPFGPLDITAFYEDVIGTIPSEPGYCLIGCQILDQHFATLANDYTGPMGFVVVALNGAPKYVS